MNDTVSDHDRRLIRLHCDHFSRSGATRDSVHHRRANLLRLAEALPCCLAEATPETLDDWQSQLARRRTARGDLLTANTLATYTQHTRSFYRWLFEAGHAETDIAGRLPKIRRPIGVAHPIPDDDLKVAIAAAREPLRTILLLAAFMGLRSMEIAQLRQDSVREVDGRLIVTGTGKGAKPFSVIVPKHVEPYLRAHLGGQGPLFRSPSGLALTSKRLSWYVADFFTRQGMPYTLHWARHSFGTSLYSQTKDLLLTRDMMRHRSANTTLIYVQTPPDRAIKAADQLAARQLNTKRRTGSGDDPPTTAPIAA